MKINDGKNMKKLSWGWRIGLIYGVFAIGTLSWVTFAMTKEVDLVRSDYYEYSLQHDKTAAAQANAMRLGARAGITLDPVAKVFLIQIPRDQATAATGSVKLYRPNSIHKDQTLALAPSADGKMVIPTNRLGKGIWHVTVDWTANESSFELTSRDSL